MENNILKEIFFDENKYWECFVKENRGRIRKVVLREVEKFRLCGEQEAGFKLFACDFCGEVKIVPHRCKGRFCNTCATGYMDEWSNKTAENMYNMPHRHIMFTMPEELWEIFLKRRELLKDLMDEAVKLLKEWFEKREKVEVGIMAGLHTFGATMIFYPHVHVMVTEGGLTKDGTMKRVGFIPYEMLRIRWRAILTKMLRKKLSGRDKKRYEKTIEEAYKNNKNGFVVSAPKNKGKVKNRERIKYIGRYIRRPAIALRRIVSYDGKVVVIKYLDKRDKKEKTEEIEVMEFIARIIRHIPDKGFKTIRYYGLYARRRKKQVDEILKVKKGKILKKKWKEKIEEETRRNPLICPRCEKRGIEIEMEYKGEVSLKNGKLVITYAKCEVSRRFLEGLLGYESGRKKKKREKFKEIKKAKPREQGIESQICMFGV
jgi:hypothetical protein